MGETIVHPGCPFPDSKGNGNQPEQTRRTSRSSRVRAAAQELLLYPFEIRDTLTSLQYDLRSRHSRLFQHYEDREERIAYYDSKYSHLASKGAFLRLRG